MQQGAWKHGTTDEGDPRGAWDLRTGAAAIGQRVGRSANFQGVYRPGDANSAAEWMNTGDTALGSQLAPQMGHISNSTRRWLHVRFVQPRANSDGQTQTTTQWRTRAGTWARGSRPALAAALLRNLRQSRGWEEMPTFAKDVRAGRVSARRAI